MKRTLFRNTFGGFLLIITLLTGFVLIATFITIRSHYLRTLSEHLESFNKAIAGRIIENLVSEESNELDSLVKYIGKQSNIRITIIDIKGIVLADSEKDPMAMENHKMRTEIREALNGKSGISIRYSRTLKQKMLYVATPLYSDSVMMGVIRSSFFLSEVNLLLNTLINRILITTFGIIALAVLVAFLFSRGLSKPFRELVDASRKVANGDFDVTILFKRKDELRELADSFNYMISQIKELISALSQEKEALNAIISSIQEGIVVFRKSGKILMANDSFKKIVGYSQTQERHYWELLRKSELNEFIDQVIQHESPHSDSKVEIAGRNYMVHAAFLPSTEHVVLTLHDVSEIMQVAAMKKDFVLNISHELRTPLTAIKGFLETMEEEKSKKSQQYLGIIKRHTDRLINIVQDLQTLSAFEDKTPLVIENIDLYSLIANVLKMFERQITSKDLTVKLNFAKPIPLIQGDSFRLEQVFINIIDNAIKYTDKGSITITQQTSESFVTIVIEDTGMGIPEEHISRIFERFYVVDKSRSRKLGGTGLGLSIVKHIIQAHKGSIEINSIVNKGTIITIALPFSQ
jgi:two-component system phosphate regulon sensor histidine kinase PhoR